MSEHPVRRLVGLVTAALLAAGTLGGLAASPAHAGAPSAAAAPAPAAAASPPPGERPVEISHVDVAPAAGRTVTDALTGLTRLSGADRFTTSVAVSRRAFATRAAAAVYVARGDVLADALAGGTLTDGPVLLLPPTGDVPAATLAEVERLDPGRVVALGGRGAVPDTQLAAAAGGRVTGRLAGSSRHATAAAIARHAFPRSAAEVYLARDVDSADAVAGGALTRGPVLLVPRGALPAAVAAELTRLSPGRVVALGGTAAVSPAVLAAAARSAGGAATARLAGADRYETAGLIASHAFPSGAPVAYLAGGTALADAVSSGSLSDGPVLLAPPPGARTDAHTAVTAALRRLGAGSLTVIGGERAVSTATAASILTSARPTASTPTPTPPSAPTSSPPPRPAATRTAGYCDAAIRRTWPVRRGPGYTIACVDRVDADAAPGYVVLGLTTTYLYSDGTVTGHIEVARDQTDAMIGVTIVHELAHSYSYAFLTDRQRQWFAARVGQSSWEGGDYWSTPPEVWANTQGTCVGYPPPDRRKVVSCDLLTRTEASPR